MCGGKARSYSGSLTFQVDLSPFSASLSLVTRIEIDCNGDQGGSVPA